MDSKRRATVGKYGMTIEEYDALFAFQDGCCGLCEEPDPSGRRLAVDHCHQTEKIRGLLCSRCNAGLGFFRDSPELMYRAVNYLLEHFEVNQPGKD